MKVRDILKLTESDGWVLKNQEGSHRHFVHPTKPGKVIVAGNPVRTHRSVPQNLS
jgi:predicted RNA binding protein YcfA (HicA-like mRNA interferase family)